MNEIGENTEVKQSTEKKQKMFIWIAILIVIITIAIGYIITRSGENKYGLKGNVFICKNIPEVARNKGTTFEDGRVGFKEGHYTLQTGGWSVFNEKEESVEVNEDVYLCYDGSAWNDGTWYDVYSTSGEYLGSRYDKKRQ